MKLRLYASIIMISFTLLGVMAEISDNKARKLIERLDVSECVKNATSAAEFWEALQITTPQYQKTYKSINGKGDKDIKQVVDYVTAQACQYFTNVPTPANSYSFSEALSDSLGVRSLTPTFTITITDEPDMSVFGYPNGYIFITGGLYDYVKNDPMAALALASAETAHFVLQHAYAHAKWEKSRRKKKKFVNGVMGVAAVVALSTIAVAADDPWLEYDAVNAGNVISAQEIHDKYSFTYTPDQIVKADIIAYRFMQNRYGSGREYIKALRTYGFFMETDSPVDTKHYLNVADRLAVLETLDSMERGKTD